MHRWGFLCSDKMVLAAFKGKRYNMSFCGCNILALIILMLKALLVTIKNKLHKHTTEPRS
jgi:hypothetical protein